MTLSALKRYLTSKVEHIFVYLSLSQFYNCRIYEKMTFVERRARFCAAHRLHNPHKPEKWNKKMYGKCNYENWHGHNYKIKTTVAGEVNSDTGFIINFDTLSAIVEEQIIEKCDHKNLNLDVDFLQGIIPSTENLVKSFYKQLEGPINAVTDDSSFLFSVKLSETERNTAEYCPHLLLKNTP